MKPVTVTLCEDPNDPDPADMPEEVDFSNAQPNPYYERFKDDDPCARTLTPDLATLFPDDRAVDQALRQLVELGQAAVEQKQRQPAVEQNQTANA